MQGVIIKRVPEGQPNGGTAVLRIHYSADDSFTEDRVAFLRSKYTSDARWRREMEIQALALEGELLYPEFNRQRNLIEPFDVSGPERWTIWMGLDPHPRTAHGMVWEAFNKHNDKLIVGEFWPEFGTVYGPTDGVRWKTRDYAEAIQLFESDSEKKPEPFGWAQGKPLRVFRRIMDTFGSAANSDVEDEDYFQAYRNLGIELSKTGWPVNLHFDAALKGHDNLAKAQDAIGRSLLPSQQGPPIMRIFSNCFEFIDELENVRFPRPTRRPGDDFGNDASAGRESDEKVVSYQKHLLDCAHYIETARPRFIMPRRQAPPDERIYEATNY
jgi:hypothetical protein